ncbi:hybrid sensor histidine kinase/response regulator [Runella slithyformis]|uniref:Response regulator receiver sensor signal transduction histidine kinase n=1 Tax=Runella slithyformis (strain ATCC 29530 / DSM 19594 / LMG 11500 / NCIMB 11436 / LSU 4) TaxID=761193 RepID=A0A7U3ZLN7_RUNSL|nr:response regulator [Runella slithyformis]AEI49505.1 response regulator receiver sensor signal transduction histidine kinase [Runella slithyformis DSM 19594]
MNEFLNAKILVIEDEESIRENIIEMLSICGYQMSSAKDGMEGISQIMLIQPDLILCDIMMPKMDGYKVLQTLRNSATHANIPFIFLTSLSETAKIRKGMMTGADDYITKPFKFPDIIAAVENRLSRERKRKEELSDLILQYRRNSHKISSHEYNTPFGSILGFLYLLKENISEFNEEETLSMLEMMIVSCRRLKNTLDNSHLYSLLTQLDPKDTMYRQYTEGHFSVCDEWISEICQTVGHESKINLDLSVSFNITIQNAELSIAEANFRKVVMELVDNAIKFSNGTSPVHLVGLMLKDKYSLTITDRGREFKEDHIKAIAPYVQFEREKYEQQGLGLGLWISNKLLQLNNGRLTVSSLEGFTSVTVEVPLVYFQ